MSKAQYQREWRKKNPESVKNSRRRYYLKNRQDQINSARNYKLLKLFGMSREEYDQAALDQKGLCAICNKPPKMGSLAVDHCHTTGKVRQLLCHHCNTGLGNLGDDIEILQKAIEYLNKHKGVLAVHQGRAGLC